MYKVMYDDHMFQKLLFLICRVTAETYMHDHSSRSHAIVTICFTQVCRIGTVYMELQGRGYFGDSLDV